MEIIKGFIKDKENFKYEKLDQKIKYICKKITTSWRKNHYIKQKFLDTNIDWLQTEERIVLETDKNEKVCPLKGRRGRPRKCFEESSKRTQKRRMAEIAKKDQSFVKAFRHRVLAKKKRTLQFKAEEVLSLLVEAQLTKHQYLLIKKFVNTKICLNIFPSYHKILKEKKSCYPETSHTKVTESSAEVELQALLDHTAERITKLQEDVIKSMPEENRKELILKGKWGFDGSTGHSEYKQTFSNGSTSDGSLFVTSYVPLQLIAKSDQGLSSVIWKNPRPSSTRYFLLNYKFLYFNL